jgi:hypothetical protein
MPSVVMVVFVRAYVGDYQVFWCEYGGYSKGARARGGCAPMVQVGA